MRDIYLYNCCDREMLYPQPTLWCEGKDDTINALMNDGPWDVIKIFEKDVAEELVTFLLHHPEYRPKKVIFKHINPLDQVKFSIRLAGLMEIEL